jgi:hypothetical protein
MKILITGSREWMNYAAMEAAFAKMPRDVTLVHGHCPRGADAMADTLGRRFGFDLRRYPADWDRYGKGAGHIRNQEMIDKEHPDSDGVLFDFGLAFSIDLTQSHGTRDCVRRALKAGIKMVHIKG